MPREQPKMQSELQEMANYSAYSVYNTRMAEEKEKKAKDQRLKDQREKEDKEQQEAIRSMESRKRELGRTGKNRSARKRKCKEELQAEGLYGEAKRRLQKAIIDKNTHKEKQDLDGKHMKIMDSHSTALTKFT